MTMLQHHLCQEWFALQYAAEDMAGQIQSLKGQIGTLETAFAAAVRQANALQAYLRTCDIEVQAGFQELCDTKTPAPVTEATR